MNEQPHEFARQIDVKPCWYHAVRAHPHYDITSPQRDRALAAGEQAVRFRDIKRSARESGSHTAEAAAASL